jgi:hypothetical protein
MNDAVLVISGALIAGYVVIAAFFARFWRESRDRLFGLFCAAFILLAAQRVVTVILPSATFAYTIRLAAFLLIIAAIVDKNRDSR